jgi:tRNA-specific 2-thiouridylase
VTTDGGRFQLRRAADAAKDQSYVLAMLGQAQLARVLLPVGGLTKAEVRARAAALGLRTAAKPDSQDVCFITSTGGREAFLGPRIGLRPGRVVDTSGVEVGTVPAVQLVTVGQRRGMGGGGAGRRYAVSVDVAAATVVLGTAADITVDGVAVAPGSESWVDGPVAPGTAVLVQASAHGVPTPGVWLGDGIGWHRPQRRVAPGQTVALYDGDRVLGAALAA